MPVSINDGTVWRTAKSIYVNDNGTWRNTINIEVNDNGSWRSLFRLNTALTIAQFGSQRWGYLNATQNPPGAGSVSPSLTDVAGHAFELFYFNPGSSPVTTFQVYCPQGTYTQTSYGTGLAHLGYNEVLFSAAVFFDDGASKTFWNWNGDVFGLNASTIGTTVQIQARP
jgi:hypothetical protein